MSCCNKAPGLVSLPPASRTPAENQAAAATQRAHSHLCGAFHDVSRLLNSHVARGLKNNASCRHARDSREPTTCYTHVPENMASVSPPGSVNGTGCGNSVTYTGEDDENEKDKPLGQSSKRPRVMGTRCVPRLTTAEPPTAGRQPGKGEGRTTEEVTHSPNHKVPAKSLCLGQVYVFCQFYWQ